MPVVQIVPMVVVPVVAVERTVTAVLAVVKAAVPIVAVQMLWEWPQGQQDE